MRHPQARSPQPLLKEHGRYRVRMGLDLNGDDQMDELFSEESVELVRGMPMPLRLPPQQVLVVECILEKPLEALTGRADLALSPLDIHVEDGWLRGKVHNIGAAAARCELALVDARGKTQRRLGLGTLAPPVDLTPQRLDFAIELPKGYDGRWALVVDAQNKVPELYEGNNRISLAQIAAAQAMIRDVDQALADAE